MIRKMKLYSWLMALALFTALAANRAVAQQTMQPQFAVRGFHIDLRIQVMRMPALKQFAYKLSRNGINTIVMEWEGTYPFRDHPAIPNRYAYSRKEIIDFVTYCKGLGITVIPLQQSFGHVEYILRNQRYAALREDEKDLSQVCPSKPELNRQLFTQLYADLASTHPSPYIHIGCDETHLLGHCPICRKRAAEEGVSKIYFDHIKMLCDIVIGMGKIPVLWADIALKYPQYITQLPQQTIFVDWNYGWELDRFGDHQKLLAAGYQIWGSPALRSDPDNYYLTTWQHHFNNLKTFLPQCASMGYQGVVMTSWSTSGEYDALFDSSDDLKDLYAVRHTYPLSGFNLLIDAYLQAMKQNTPLNISEFITGYCAGHYGLNKVSAQLFSKALFAAPYKIVDGKVLSSKLSLTQLLDSARNAAAIMASLRPTKNQQEFAQYRLMSDIRVYYLTYQQIAASVNSEGANEAGMGKYIAQLKALMATEPALNARFAQLNGYMLYPAAIQDENNIRNYQTHRLYQQLTRVK